MPTFSELAGARAPQGIDGFSVLPALQGKRQKPHDFLYWELPRYNGKTGEFRKETPMQAVRMGDWKAVRPKPDAALELYNLKADIGETKNVAAENPKVMARIEDFLKTARVEPRTQTEPPHDWWGPADW
jgi:arylsulfatase A-like enzyme